MKVICNDLDSSVCILHLLNQSSNLMYVSDSLVDCRMLLLNCHVSRSIICKSCGWGFQGSRKPDGCVFQRGDRLSTQRVGEAANLAVFSLQARYLRRVCIFKEQPKHSPKCPFGISNLAHSWQPMLYFEVVYYLA